MSDLLLTELQRDIAARLEADEICGRVRVVTERRGDVLAEINRALATVNARSGLKGLALVVLQIEGDDTAPDYPVPVLEVRPVVRVLEEPNANKSGDLDALTLAYRVALLFKLWTCHGKTSPFTGAEPMIVGVEDILAPLAYDVRFVARQKNVQNNRKAATPVITPSSGAPPQTVALACATVGAEIWYTLDGSYPVPGQAGSTEYSAPIDIDYPLTLRAVAYLSGYIASDASESVFE